MVGLHFVVNENDDFISFASLLMSKKLNSDVFRGWTFGGDNPLHISESNQARKFIFDTYRHLGFMHQFVRGASDALVAHIFLLWDPSLSWKLMR